MNEQRSHQWGGASPHPHFSSQYVLIDLLPTFLLQELVNVLLLLLMTLCNRSIRDGILPPSLKKSMLIPALWLRLGPGQPSELQTYCQRLLHIQDHREDGRRSAGEEQFSPTTPVWLPKVPQNRNSTAPASV